MKHEELQHVLRAAAEICEDNEFVVIGSQSILATDATITDSVIVRSMEADLYPLHDPSRSERLGAIGLDSPFHVEFGYYADGVDETTGVFPKGWETRRLPVAGPNAITVRGAQARGWCPEVHDLLISKLVAARDKDIEYCRAVIARGMCDRTTLLERLKATRLRGSRRKFVRAQIESAFESSSEHQ